MIPEELCIGNWVRRRWTCSDTGREVVKDFQITEIRKNVGTLYAWGKGGNMGRVEQLESIPLTPEILEKNGWRCFNTYHKYSHPKAPFDIRQQKDGGYTIEVDVNEYGSAAFLFILYVHQLQHAIRLCGIEKEIEL